MLFRVMILALVIIGCTTNSEPTLENPGNSGKVSVVFENTTSLNIYSLEVYNQKIGGLDAGEISSKVSFADFGFDTGMPDEDAVAIIDGKACDNFERNYWCGTEKIRVDTGSYHITISVSDTNLYLSCTNPPYLMP